MAEDLPHYCIDTSSLIHWWDEAYSPDIFEGLPDRMSGLISVGRLCAARAVKDEIKDSQEPFTLAKWCKRQNNFYIEDDERVQSKVKELMSQFHNPRKTSGISGADPFVISRAKLNGDHWYVVSEENPSNGNAHKNPNIPFVCNRIGVKHIGFIDMLRLEGWKLT